MGIEMRKWIVVFALAALPVSAAASDVNETRDAAADGSVEIYNTAGSVTVEGWTRNEVEVIGTLGNEVEDFIFEREGDDIIIKVKAKSGRSGGRGFTSDLAVKVPKDSSIDVATVSADIEVTGAEDRVTISGQKAREVDDDLRMVISERRFGSFKRVVKVEDAIDSNRITARLENGVLRIEAPRKNIAQAQSVKIHIDTPEQAPNE